MAVENLVSVDEAARFASCHPVTIRRMIRRGDLPGYKVGSHWRLKISDLEAALGATPERQAERRPKGRFARLVQEMSPSSGRSS